MAFLPKMSTLVAIAGGAGIGIGCMTLLLDKERHTWANRKASFITKAIDLMNEQPEIKELLGEKIEVGKASFNDGWGSLKPDHVQLKVPIKGERDNAFLFAYARRRDEKSKYRLYKLEATFGKIENKKLIIMDRTKEVDEEPEEAAKGADNSGAPPHQAGVCEKKDRRQLDKEIMKSWQ